MRLEGHEGQPDRGGVALKLGQSPTTLGGDATGGHAIEGGKGSHAQGESGEDDELGTIHVAWVGGGGGGGEVACELCSGGVGLGGWVSRRRHANA